MNKLIVEINYFIKYFNYIPKLVFYRFSVFYFLVL